MTGIQNFNAEEFLKTAKHLENEGFEVFNPAQHDLDAGFNPFGCSGHESKDELAELGFSLRGALAADLDWIARNAQYVAVMDGWESSKGVAAELALADALGIPVVEPWSLMYDAKYGDVEYELKREERTIVSRSAEIKYPLPLWERENLTELPTVGFSEATVKNMGQKGLDMLKESAKLMDGGAKLTVSETGGQKGSKEARYDLIPVQPLEYLARLYGKGAEKYDDNNWAKGYDWKFSYAAMQRHANQFWGGEDNDPEMGLPHLASVAWHAFTMMYFMENYPEYDSRLKEKPKS